MLPFESRESLRAALSSSAQNARSSSAVSKSRISPASAFFKISAHSSGVNLRSSPRFTDAKPPKVLSVSCSPASWLLPSEAVGWPDGRAESLSFATAPVVNPVAMPRVRTRASTTASNDVFLYFIIAIILSSAAFLLK